MSIGARSTVARATEAVRVHLLAHLDAVSGSGAAAMDSR
jgi:hypothetical protein